ncbi:hypothetical protein MKL32_03925 [Acinetobacter sp. AOR34_HL]|uniref:hypothetical protein n=1 Tax=Acinetobacter sp. AOR34_HL TaxID=2919384 RepID=UPI0022EB99B2|nr:hypothetical protein [Acinetobacter sp. AOR34_HL]MDA3500761.1 hypothetical protein [Acinetobacter sp. AOR34_HL]
MGIMQKYIIVVESEKPPKVHLQDIIPQVGKVLELKSEELPHRVDTKWVMERYEMARTTVIEFLKPFNKGSGGKYSYDPHEIIPLLDNRHKSKRGARRKN